MTIHEKLRKLREERDIKQKEVAKYIGVSERVYGYYEKDRFPKDEAVLKKLSDFYNVSVEWLVGASETPNTEKERGILTKELYSVIKELNIEEINALKFIKKSGYSIVELRKLVENLQALKK